jgi:hypothetical protein
MILTVQTVEDVDHYLATIERSAAAARVWLRQHDGDGLDLLRQMKFATVGVHPIEGRPLNLIEQVNQSWTYAVALAAARHLLQCHPEAGGFHVAPGAHMAIPLDIMSVADGLVGAETFATVHPRNNGKLTRDIAKMAARPETHRYVFFSSPDYPELMRLTKFGASGVEVWSVKV